MLVIVDSQSNATTVLKYGVPENIYIFGVSLGCNWGVIGVPENINIFGALKKMAAQNVNFVACGQVGFPHKLLLVANEAVPL